MLKILSKFEFYLKDIHRINHSLSRGSLSAATRMIDPVNPNTWEFSAFSQNGEDGIIDYLSRIISHPNFYFIEIGAGTGIENNCSYLSIARRFSGLFIEGSPKQSIKCRRIHEHFNLGVKCLNMVVNSINIEKLKSLSPHHAPDLMSVDIDSFDFHIVEKLLDCGFFPKIFIVEYNSAFGPERAVTVLEDGEFEEIKAKTDGLYYGASIEAWKRLFSKHGYRFLCAESNGVNAFFARPECFRIDFEALRGYSFRENFYQLRKFGSGFEEQYEIIKDCEYRHVEMEAE